MAENEPDILRELIGGQDYLVTRAQALGAGLSENALRHRLRKGGPWRACLPGVYLTVTGTPTQAQRETAAALYGGPRSVITGAAALRYHRLPAPEREVTDVLVPAAVQRQSISYVSLHRTTRMPARVCGLPQRSYALPARAAADAARWLTDGREARAVIAGVVQSSGCTVGELTEECRAGQVRDSALLRAALSETGDGVRSAPEAELRALIKKARLPMPLFNPSLYLRNGTFLARPDAWWPDAGVAIEIDSRRWHFSPDDWERTMDRHAAFGEHSIVTLHFTPHRLRTDPVFVVTKMKNAYKSGITRPPLPITALPVVGLPEAAPARAGMDVAAPWLQQRGCHIHVGMPGDITG
jgi:hypothetical protein